MTQAAGGTMATGIPLDAAGKALAATHLIGLFITSYDAHSLDEGMARVVHTSLNALVQGPAIWGCLVTEPGVDGWRQVAGHAVVVLSQVGVLSTVGGGTNEFYGARGPQHLCLCSTETLGAGMGRGAQGGVKYSAYPQQLGAGRQLQALQGKGRAGTEPRQESTGKSGAVLREWLLIKHTAGPQSGRTCRVSSGAT